MVKLIIFGVMSIFGVSMFVINSLVNQPSPHFFVAEEATIHQSGITL